MCAALAWPIRPGKFCSEGAGLPNSARLALMEAPECRLCGFATIHAASLAPLTAL